MGIRKIGLIPEGCVGRGDKRKTKFKMVTNQLIDGKGKISIERETNIIIRKKRYEKRKR